MSCFLRSNIFKFFAILFVLLIVFCGAILLATFSAEKVAFADEVGPVYNFNQILQNGNFVSLSNWTCTRGTLSLGANSLTYTITDNGGTAHRNRIDNTQSLTFNSGHVYAFIFYLSCDFSANFHIGFNLGGSPEVYSNLQVVSSSSTNHFVTVVSPSDITSNIFFAIRMNASDAVVGDSFLLRNIMLVDLTDLGLPSLTSFAEWHSLFPSTFYGYTTGTLISPSYDEGYNDGANYGYDLGYDAGYANGLLEVTANTFVSDRTTWSNYDSLFPFINSNGTVVYNNPLWSVGYEDMFVFGSIDPTSYSYSFNYTMGSYNGSVNTVVSSNYYTFGEDPETHEQYIAVTLDNDYVEFSLVMFAHRSYLNLDIVDTNGTSFLPLNYTDLYKVTVFRNNDSNTIFQAGVEFADSRLNETSVSYNTGFSRGVNDAQKYTFYTLIDSVIFSPISMIQHALNFNILGMNMRDFFMSLFTIAVVLYLVRLFLGASSGGGE